VQHHRILICSKIRSLVFLSKVQVEAEVKDRERKKSLQNLNLNLDLDLLRLSYATLFNRLDSSVATKASILFLVSASEYDVISMISLSRIREGSSL
jgi:hypothetical protein